MVEYSWLGEEPEAPVPPTLYSPTTPTLAEAERGLKAERELNIPAAVGARIPRLDQQITVKESQKLLKGSTALPEWLKDPINGALAKDDLKSLNAIEKMGNAAYRGGLAVPEALRLRLAERNLDMAQFVGRSHLEIRNMILPPEEREALQQSGQYQAIAAYMEDAAEVFHAVDGKSPDEFTGRAITHLKRAGEIKRRREGLKGFDATERVKARLAPANATKDNLEQMAIFFDAISADPLDSMVFIGETLLEITPALAAGAATTAATRSPWAGASVMGLGSGSMEFSGKAQEFLQANGINLATEDGVRLLMTRPEVMREAVSKGFAKGIVVGLLDTVSGGIAGKALAASPVGNILAQAGVQALLGGAGEAVGDLAAGDDVNMANVLLEALVEIAGAPAEVAGVGGRGLRGLLKRTESAASAGSSKAVLEAVSAAATESKLRERDGGRWRSLLDRTDWGKVTLRVPADDLQTLFQAKDTGPEAFEIDPQAYETALASGGMVEVSGEVFVDKIAASEDAAWFHEHATLSDDEMTAAEAKRFAEGGQEVVEEIRAEVEKDAEKAQKAREGAQKVFDAIRGQLRDANMSPTSADANASVAAALFSAAAEKMGRTADDLAGDFNLQVKAERNAPMPQPDWTSAAIDALRAREAGEEIADANTNTVLDKLKADIEAAGQTLNRSNTEIAAALGENYQPDVLQQGWREVAIQIEDEAGTPTDADAGFVMDNLNRRLEEARAILRCVNG